MRSIGIFFLATCAAGCANDMESVEQTRSELVSSNRLAMNRLASNRLATNRIATNRLATNRLANNRLASNRLAANRIATNRLATNRIQLDPAAAGDLLETEDGREVLSYTIQCALRADQKTFVELDGITYEFEGALGLAPHWLEHPLSEQDQRWVSACLLSRVNATGVSVLISLRGPHRALSTSADERESFGREEGAFWGNVFGSPNDPLDWNACRGRGQSTGEQGDLADRDCTEPDPAKPAFTLCGFKYAGDCGEFATQSACEHYDSHGPYYERCSTAEQRGAASREVITTFVK